ncbi:MAG TPA: hypothetical protein PKV43_01780 [Armatimonadota bacterium]|nr:hypothetical protein [Armatimonadota bacterium]
MSIALANLTKSDCNITVIPFDGGCSIVFAENEGTPREKIVHVLLNNNQVRELVNGLQKAGVFVLDWRPGVVLPA